VGRLKNKKAFTLVTRGSTKENKNQSCLGEEEAKKTQSEVQYQNKLLNTKDETGRRKNLMIFERRSSVSV
jgi:hypothetical protein